MSLAPHQERVVAEYDDLNTNVERLEAFLGIAEDYPPVSPDERSRLQLQLHIMRAYAEVLLLRIDAF